MIPQNHDKHALFVLGKNSIGINDIDISKEAALKKITGIEPTWYMHICNKDLYVMTEEEKLDIINNLDIDKYVGLIEANYEKNWRNIIPC